MKFLHLVLVFVVAGSGAAVAVPKTARKEKPLPKWTAREESYVKGVDAKLDALKDDNPRKLIKQYFAFLHEPTDDKAKDFTDRALKLREKSGKPLVGLWFFSIDKSLCPNPKGDCSYGIGNITDKHLAALLHNGNAGAIRVALVRHMVSAPTQSELMSYYADFRVPKIVDRHQLEVLTVLHDLRDALAKYNPGPACYQFKFFDVRLNPEKIRKVLPAKEAEELIGACVPPTEAKPKASSPTPSAAPSQAPEKK